MGRSFELLGLAGFNVFLALILSVTFLSGSNSTAIQELTNANVEKFVQEVADIASGKRADMDDYSITTYFMTHIEENSQFNSTLQYDMPDTMTEKRHLKMDKLNFISHTLQGQQMMTNHETLTVVEHIKIDDAGRNATVLITNYERGVMPLADADGEASMVPVTGTSYCEQQIVLDHKNIMKMAGANCTTDISFADAF